MATVQDIAGVVALINATGYAGFEPTEWTLEVYRVTLQDLERDWLMGATLEAIAEPGRKFAPTPGDIRLCAWNILRRRQGLPDAFQAWEEVRRAFRSHGKDKFPEFSSLLIVEAVRSLGWRSMCESENEVSERARFLECYKEVQQRAVENEMRLPAVKALIGGDSSQVNALLQSLAGSKSITQIERKVLK